MEKVTPADETRGGGILVFGTDQVTEVTPGNQRIFIQDSNGAFLGKIFELAAKAPKKPLPHFMAKTRRHQQMGVFARNLIEAFVDKQPDHIHDNPLFEQRVEQAFARVDAGTFGRCSCGISLSMKVLLEKPLTEYCPACAKKAYLARSGQFLELINDKARILALELDGEDGKGGLEGQLRALGMEESAQRQSADQLDKVTDTGARDVLRRRIGTKRQELDDLRHVLMLIDAGEYGRCETCGQDIPVGRLKVLPFARTCVHCKEKPAH